MISLDYITGKVNKMLEVAPYGLISGVLLTIVEKYLFADWHFLISLLIIVTLDTGLGIYISIVEKRFSSHGFSHLLTKMIVYLALCILAHQLIHIDLGYGTPLLSVLKYGLYMSMIFRETLSIFENAGKLGYGLPKKYLKYLKDFNEKGEYVNDQPKDPNQK